MRNFLLLIVLLAAGLSVHAKDFTSLNSTIISTTPAGRVYLLYKTSNSYYKSWGYLRTAAVDGKCDSLVVADDGKVYLKDPLSQLGTRSWLEGKIEGDSVFFDTPQFIWTEDNPSYDEPVKFYASRMVTKTITSGYSTSTTYVPDSVETRMKFVWRNDSIIQSDDALLGLIDSASFWYAFGDKDVVYAVNNDKVAAVPEGLSAVKYMLKTVDVSGNTETKVVKAYTDGVKVYITGLYDEFPDAVVVGTLADGNVVIKSGQLLGVNASGYFVYAEAATYTTGYDSSFKTVYKYTFADDLTLTYNAADGTYSSDGALIINIGKNKVSAVKGFVQPKLDAFTEVAATPADPVITDLAVMDYKITFNLPNTDTEGNYLDVSKLYYNVYLDNKLYTFEPMPSVGLYDSMPYESLTDVPYTFDDDDDFRCYGIQHSLKLNPGSFTTIGIQLVYTGGGEVHKSDIVSKMSTLGIEDVGSDKGEIKRVDYYDLDGRKISGPLQGIYVKSEVYKNGTVKRTKVVK